MSALGFVVSWFIGITLIASVMVSSMYRLNSLITVSLSLIATVFICVVIVLGAVFLQQPLGLDL